MAGWACGCRWKHRLLADDEPKHLTGRVPPPVRKVPDLGGASVLLSIERLLATVSFAQHGAWAAAVVMHGIEQLVPEGAGAEAGHDSQVEADIGNGAAYRAATHLALQFRQCGCVSVGKRPPGWTRCGIAGGGLSARGGAGWCGLSAARADAGAGERYVAAAGGTGEQNTLQSDGTQDAAVEAGEDNCEIEGAETRRDGGEAGCGGAVLDGVGEMAAVGQQDANDVEECRNALG